MSNLDDNIKAVHRQLDTDLAAGDHKAKGFAGMFGGDLKASRNSLNLPPLKIPHDPKLSGLVLFGSSEMMVGLASSQWLRIPLSAFAEVDALSEDDRLDYQLETNRTELHWRGTEITLSLTDLFGAATSLEDGGEGPN